jgi:hypothetical protein
MSLLNHFRRQKDEWFKLSDNSPIPEEQRAAFQGLNYYPENTELRFTTQIEEFSSPEPITMITSTGDTQEYLRWGRMRFMVEGQPAELTVYYASWGDYFVPFTDATSGSETYDAGRYMELEEQDDGMFLVDFNLAYNPYCAYSPAYSCPIPPAENRLSVPIRAGEKVYEK